VADPLLRLDHIAKSFGGVQAVKDLSLQIHPGEILGLIGPNGSGKSTSVNLISGTLPVSSGTIHFAGAPVHGLGISQRVPLGLARTFQTTTLFHEFSVLEHVRTACHSTFASAPGWSLLRTRAARQEDRAQLHKARELIDFVGLGDVVDADVASISSAQQRLLMIATALASDPRLVLLDEPAAGMVAKERKALSQLILDIRARGIAVLVIEHHMGLIMQVCERIAVLNFGQKIAEGIPSEIRANPLVIDAYLGGTR
jgi:ABC-type branched-subunit amino acid transport system ATPase component